MKVVLTTGVSPKSLGAKFVESIASCHPKLLILAGRDLIRVNETVDSIRAIAPEVVVRTLLLDLSSQRAVREAAREVNGYGENIDVLVNSAGIMASPYWTTEDEIEGQFGTNHIGPFLFTNLIMGKLLASGCGRVVNISSNEHRLSPVRYQDHDFQDGEYHKWKSYGQSKTANILFAVSLAEKLGSRGLTAFSLHPGQTATRLGRYISAGDINSLRTLDRELDNKEGHQKQTEIKTISQSVATFVVAAFDPDLLGCNGAYLQDCGIAPAEDIKFFATDKDLARKLWSLSENLVGQRFTY